MTKRILALGVISIAAVFAQNAGRGGRSPVRRRGRGQRLLFHNRKPENRAGSNVGLVPRVRFELTTP